ncbi:hypothetical protein GCM10022280_13200 [Sphingomonas swuensis]|uniref:PilZ domain-containing protein n=2 Tax=Sphingomonas swuensis TaxID=977800 RepID=A0ABP7SSC2_9SPHN
MFGGKPAPGPLLRSKEPKAAVSRSAEDESFSDLSIPRSSGRIANHRDTDRHRLEQETALLVRKGGNVPVTLINLSGGGAMIEGGGDLKLWDRIELELGACRVEAIVRWIRGERVGLEFAHETRIATDSKDVAETLRAVIRRSFPDIALEAEMAVQHSVDEATEELGDEVGEPAFEERAERELRHPLIWSGLIHFNHESTPVRLRNISSGGALVEGAGVFPVGAELLLDLGDAGAIFSTVNWARGDQAGLAFHAPYELSRLAEARPEVASARWVAPAYLRDDRTGSSPWAAQWERHDLASLHRKLSAPSPIRKR